MTDEELLTAFQSCSLPSSSWNHEAHVRIAFLYSTRHDASTALMKVRDGIRAYNAATNTPEAIDRGYHETMTVAFMQLVRAALLQDGPYESSAAFCAAHPELMTKLALRRYYSRERILTLDAKATFVPPDVCPLPAVSEADE